MPTRTKEPFTDIALSKDEIIGKTWVKGALGRQTEERGSRIPIRNNNKLMRQKYGRVLESAEGVYF